MLANDGSLEGVSNNFESSFKEEFLGDNNSVTHRIRSVIGLNYHDLKRDIVRTQSLKDHDVKKAPDQNGGSFIGRDTIFKILGIAFIIFYWVALFFTLKE